MALTSPPTARRLELSDEQVKRIRWVFEGYTADMRRLMARMHNAVQDAPPEQRRQRYRQLQVKIEAERAKRIKALYAKVLGLTAGRQRQAAAKILGVPLADEKPQD